MVSAIATNVKRIIKEKGMLQKAVAEKAGYDLKVFNNMLNGRRTITDCDIIPIAHALDVSPNDLFAYAANDRAAG